MQVLARSEDVAWSISLMCAAEGSKLHSVHACKQNKWPKLKPHGEEVCYSKGMVGSVFKMPRLYYLLANYSSNSSQVAQQDQIVIHSNNINGH